MIKLDFWTEGSEIAMTILLSRGIRLVALRRLLLLLHFLHSMALFWWEAYQILVVGSSYS